MAGVHESVREVAAYAQLGVSNGAMIRLPTHAAAAITRTFPPWKAHFNDRRRKLPTRLLFGDDDGSVLNVTHFDDGTPYSYGPGAESGDSVNVGWLGKGHHYATGEMPSGVVEALLRLTRDNRFNTMRGWHVCELCENPDLDHSITMDVDGRSVFLGHAEVRVTGETGVIYAAPTQIAHYVEAHGYRPPDDFAAGLMRRIP